MTLTWTEPQHNGGRPITGYIIEKRENFGLLWTRDNKEPVTDTTYSIKGLIEGYQYEFRVIAQNQIGLGKPSEPTHPPRVAKDPASKFENNLVTFHSKQRIFIFAKNQKVPYISMNYMET